MENEIQIFSNAEFGEVRTILIDGEPWFVGRDVAEVLKYSNTRDALTKHVDDEEKGVAKCDTLGGKQDLVVINESGLYSLVFSSKLPKAKEFKHWVTAEVLPSIRQTGMYSIDDEDAFMAQAVLLANNRINKLQAEVKQLEVANNAQAKKIEEDAPKVRFSENIHATDGVVKISTAAQDLGFTPEWFRDRLVEDKYMSRKGYVSSSGKIRYEYRAYQRALDMGILKNVDSPVKNLQDSVKTVVKVTTGKGLQFFFDKYERVFELKKIEDKIKHIEGLKRKTKDKLEELAVLCEQRDLLKSPALLN